MAIPQTSEQFGALLLRIRDHAEAVAARLWARQSVVQDEQNEVKIADARAVWHASEIALRMLSSDYVPKREAMLQVADLVDGWRKDGLIDEGEG